MTTMVDITDRYPLLILHIGSTTIFWCALYRLIAIRSRWSNKSSEWIARMVSFLHAQIVTGLALWSALIDGPWPFTTHAAANTPLQEFTMCLTLGYLLFDLGWCFNERNKPSYMTHVSSDNNSEKNNNSYDPRVTMEIVNQLLATSHHAQAQTLVEKTEKWVEADGKLTHLRHDVSFVDKHLAFGLNRMPMPGATRHDQRIMAIHHILSGTALFSSIFLGISGSEVVATMGLGEATNPFLQMRWFLNTSGKQNNHPDLAELNERIFLALFTYIRLFVGGYLLYVILKCRNVLKLFKIVGIGLYLIGYIFLKQLFAYAVAKYTHPPYENSIVSKTIWLIVRYYRQMIDWSRSGVSMMAEAIAKEVLTKHQPPRLNDRSYIKSLLSKSVHPLDMKAATLFLQKEKDAAKYLGLDTQPSLVTELDVASIVEAEIQESTKADKQLSAKESSRRTDFGGNKPRKRFKHEPETAIAKEVPANKQDLEFDEIATDRVKGGSTQSSWIEEFENMTSCLSNDDSQKQPWATQTQIDSLEKVHIQFPIDSSASPELKENLDGIYEESLCNFIKTLEHGISYLANDSADICCDIEHNESGFEPGLECLKDRLFNQAEAATTENDNLIDSQPVHHMFAEVETFVVGCIPLSLLKKNYIPQKEKATTNESTDISSINHFLTHSIADVNGLDEMNRLNEIANDISTSITNYVDNAPINFLQAESMIDPTDEIIN